MYGISKNIIKVQLKICLIAIYTYNIEKRRTVCILVRNTDGPIISSCKKGQTLVGDTELYKYFVMQIKLKRDEEKNVLN